MHGRNRLRLVVLVALGLLASLAVTGRAADPRTAQTDTAIGITAFDLGFEPTLISVPAAGRYSFMLKNTGALPHDLMFADGTTTPAAPGEASDRIDVDVPAEGIAFWCSIVGHREAGMEGLVRVASSSASQLVAAVEPDPDAPEPGRYDPVVPSLGDGDTVDIDLNIEEVPFTVAPGYQVAAWTFGGTVPGPVIRVKVGDTVRVRVSNSDSSQTAHGVDFGASQVAPNDEMIPIEPGDAATYVWKAEYAGVWLYQGTGTTPFEDVANGLYGMVIVDPRGGLPPVNQEFALVQGEWSVDEQGQPPSLARAAAGTPDFAVFNGVANQYQDEPLPVGVDESVRFFVLDAGPSRDSSFSISGAVFSRVIKEGIELAAGNPGNWGAQTVDLSPGQGAIVETAFAEDGLYPFFSRAGDLGTRGASGLIEAGDGDPSQ